MRVVVPVVMLAVAALAVLLTGAVNEPVRAADASKAATEALVRRAMATAERIESRLDEQTAVSSAEVDVLERKPPPAPAGELDMPQPVVSQAPDPVETASFSVTAIFWSEQLPMAVVNGRLVEAGKVIDGFRVDRIDKESVVIAGQLKKRIVRLYTGDLTP